jgi:hypothetical protein
VLFVLNCQRHRPIRTTMKHGLPKCTYLSNTSPFLKARNNFSQQTWRKLLSFRSGEDEAFVHVGCRAVSLGPTFRDNLEISIKSNRADKLILTPKKLGHTTKWSHSQREYNRSSWRAVSAVLMITIRNALEKKTVTIQWNSPLYSLFN